MKRLLLSGLLLIAILAITITVLVENKHPPIDNSLETIFTMLGKPIKTLDRSFTRAIGVSVEDEKALGDLLAKRFAPSAISDHPANDYLNDLVNQMAKQYNPKGLQYRIYVSQGAPNAFALPGGIISVTTGLLDILETESQLIAILGHEKGHIDLGHCIDLMRTEAKIQKKSNKQPHHSFIDYYLSQLWSLNFSKYQESEADVYGFETLISLNYEPTAMSESFQKLIESSPHHERKGVMVDYFKTHPSTEIRAQNWREKAARWHHLHPSKKMYRGKKNYAKLRARSKHAYSDEWS